MNSITRYILKSNLPFYYGDFHSYDRWRFIKNTLRYEGQNKKIVDLGCGKGTYAIELAKSGKSVNGINISEEDVIVARKRCEDFMVNNCFFEVDDLRELGKRKDLFGKFDVAICSEVIEHILNDKKLLKDINKILVDGGALLLTTPFYKEAHLNNNLLKEIEDGGHVREGYNLQTLKKLLKESGFICEDIGYCTGSISMALSRFIGEISKINYFTSRVIALPFKLFYWIIDMPFTKMIGKNPCSICIHAKKIKAN
ncbi:MAG: class I SAM-dependent methyltransferase [archaeon]